MSSPDLYRYVDTDRPKTKISIVCVYYRVKSLLLIVIKLKVLKEKLLLIEVLTGAL